MKFSNNRLTLAAASLVFLISGCTKKLDEAFLNPNAAIKQPIEELMDYFIHTENP